MMTFAERLRHYREKAKFSQKRLAEKIGVGFATYNNYETKGYEPKIEVLIKIANTLGIDVNTLVGFQEQKELKINRSDTLIILYAVKYALSCNGYRVAKHVIEMAIPLLPYLPKKELFAMEKCILHNWEDNEIIGTTPIYNEDWTKFCLAIREERRKRGAVM